LRIYPLLVKKQNMNRRNFFKNTALAGAGLSILPSLASCTFDSRKKAKNIIFLVSDGMSMGTLSMADLLMQRKFGQQSTWITAYAENLVKRALMETGSASSMVTDSAAASSSWGSGHRVNNGALNIGTNGERYTPILQKFKRLGKKVGCVTSVPITHATPAGFCVNEEKRGSMDAIADSYLPLRFDVMMGGGQKYFSENHREDKRDLFAEFRKAGYQVATNKFEFNKLSGTQPVLGAFAEEALPYSVDHENSQKDIENIPSLSELSAKAIELLNTGDKGFVMQIEAGKVDWAAHGNDISALLYDQLEFDKAVKVALDFAALDGETLVIITTDHGNANPGLIYGKKANKNFERLFNFRHSNEWILNKINSETTIGQIREITEQAQGFAISAEEAEVLKNHYATLTETELYNPRKLPFAKLAEIQFNYTSVGWAAGNHTADLVELAMFGPGSERLKPFVKNFELHNFMLRVTGALEDLLEI
jgi:alkaline phosphatase